jgi:hypothetical protein
MKKWSSLFYPMFCFFTLALKAVEPLKTESCTNPTTALYVNPEGEVTQPIAHLLKLTGFDATSLQLADVVAATYGQAHLARSWGGSPTKERWEKDPQKVTLSLAQAKKVIDICSKELGQDKAVNLQATHPKGVLFLGAALLRVRKRLSYLNELYATGILSPSIPVYLLTGERKLDPAVGETPAQLINPDNGLISFRKDWRPSGKSISDEGDMVELVFAQSRYKNLQKKNIHLVYSPKGSERRATAASTVRQWVKDFSPEPGTYVAISNAPYIFYQECVIRRVLLQLGRNDICVHVVGPHMEEKNGDDAETIKGAQNFLSTTTRILKELLEIQQVVNKPAG